MVDTHHGITRSGSFCVARQWWDQENYQKELRDFLIDSEYLSGRVILNSEQLYRLRNKVKNIEKERDVVDKKVEKFIRELKY